MPIRSCPLTEKEDGSDSTRADSVMSIYPWAWVVNYTLFVGAMTNVPCVTVDMCMLSSTLTCIICLFILYSLYSVRKDYNKRTTTYTNTQVNRDSHTVMQTSLQSIAIKHNSFHSSVCSKDWTISIC